MKHPNSGRFRVVGLLKGRLVVFENCASTRYLTGETREEVAKWEDLDEREREVLGFPKILPSRPEREGVK